MTLHLTELKQQNEIELREWLWYKNLIKRHDNIYDIQKINDKRLEVHIISSILSTKTKNPLKDLFLKGDRFM